jgi:hypothetical protein
MVQLGRLIGCGQSQTNYFYDYSVRQWSIGHGSIGLPEWLWLTTDMTDQTIIHINWETMVHGSISWWAITYHN